MNLKAKRISNALIEPHCRGDPAKHKKEIIMEENRLEIKTDWQTKSRGSNKDEYEIYLSCANDGHGIDFTTGKPLKSFEEWMKS